MFLNDVFIGFTGLVGEFDILDKNTSTQGLAYDHQSVMHLGLSAFAKLNTRSMIPFEYSCHVSYRAYPTPLDILHTNILYCEGNVYMHMQLQ